MFSGAQNKGLYADKMGFWNVLFGILNMENLFPLLGVDTGQTVVLSIYLSN